MAGSLREIDSEFARIVDQMELDCGLQWDEMEQRQHLAQLMQQAKEYKKREEPGYSADSAHEMADLRTPTSPRLPPRDGRHTDPV